MKKYESLYKKLSKQYSDEEIAESHLIPEDLTDEEKKAAHEEIRKYRFQRLREMTEQQRLLSDIMRLRFQIEKHIETGEYNEGDSFGSYLGEYVHILKKTKKEFSQDLNIHYTKLSRLFSGQDDPNIDICYRLEQHCGKMISALLWWKLSVKKIEAKIKKDKERKKAEAGKVKNALVFS